MVLAQTEIQQEMISTNMIDLIICGIYLAGILYMGLHFSRRQTTTDHYFLGNRNFPGWAVGLSMLGTSISSITFLALPAAAFALDWRQLVPSLMLPVGLLLAAIVFIPFFRQGRATTAYEYLGKRYGPMVRLYSAISFIIIQVIRTGMILYLISLPLSGLVGLGPVWVIILFGIFIAVYTIAGGIEAVIWTDVIQAGIFWVGGIVIVSLVAIKLPNGLSQIIHVGFDQGKFGIGSMDLDLSHRTFWVMAMTGIFGALNNYTADQTVIQRYIAASSLREARKATLICGITSIPSWIFFYFIGTSIFVFYHVFPETALKEMHPDGVMPYFIQTQVPVGFCGLIIASLLSAAMSSLDSSINSISTIAIVDIVKEYFLKDKSEKLYLFLSRLLATIASLIMIFLALLFYFLPKESSVDLQFILKSIFGGVIMGFFLLGFFTEKVDYKSSLIALVLAIIFNVYLGLSTIGFLPESWRLDAHPYWVFILVNCFFMILGYIISLIRRQFPTKEKLYRLTVWTTPIQRKD